MSAGSLNKLVAQSELFFFCCLVSILLDRPYNLDLLHRKEAHRHSAS